MNDNDTNSFNKQSSTIWIVKKENNKTQLDTIWIDVVLLNTKSSVTSIHETNLDLLDNLDWGIFRVLERNFSENEIWKKAKNIVRLKEEWFLIPETYIIPHKFLKENNFNINLDKIVSWWPWIVRSSSLEEDNLNQTNAGVFKSIVVNGDKKDLLPAINDVVEHALSINATPSVIIQEYIEGTFYGVWFSKFLLDNNAYLPVVEFSSKAEAVTWWVDKVQRYCFLWADKEIELKPPLDFLSELKWTLEKVEWIFDWEQDIEFAVKDDLVYLLQSRDCVNTLNNTDWWTWTSRSNTPIFPCLFRTQVDKNYTEKYNSYNQYILVNQWDTTHIIYNKNDIKTFQDNWIKELLESKNNYHEKEKDFKIKLKKLIKFSRNLEESTEFDSNENIVENIEEYRSLYAMCVNISNEAFLWWFALEKYLRTWLDLYLKNIDIDLTTAQVFNILTNSTNRSSWSESLKRNISSFSENLTEDLNNYIANNDYNSFINNINDFPELHQKWTKIYEKYKWLWFNWIWPWLTYQTMFDILKGVVNNRKSKKSYNEKEELFKSIWINKKDQYLFDLLAHFVYLKDWRNGMYSMAAYYFYDWLKKISITKEFDVEILYNMSLKEVKEFILNNTYTENNENDLVVWSNEWADEILLVNEDAEKYLNDKNVTIFSEYDEDVDALYGEAVSEWIITWKARIFSSKNNYSYWKNDIIIATSVHPTETWMIANVWWIIVEEWGITSHISILAREAGIPCIINVENACKIINENEDIMLDANQWCVIRNEIKK